MKKIKLAKDAIYRIMLALIFLPGKALAGHNELHKGAQVSEGSFTENLLFGSGGEQGVFERIVNTIIFLVGAVSVLMLVVGAIRYVTSAGDENAVKGAKNTILYAIIGIVIALLAFAIIEFIIGRISPS